MTEIRQEQNVLHCKLMYLLHRGLVDIRNLAFAQEHRQVADLADAMEMVPSFIGECDEAHVEMIRSVFRGYQEKYGTSAYGYLAVLDMDDAKFLETYASW